MTLETTIQSFNLWISPSNSQFVPTRFETYVIGYYLKTYHVSNLSKKNLSKKRRPPPGVRIGQQYAELFARGLRDVRGWIFLLTEPKYSTHTPSLINFECLCRNKCCLFFDNKKKLGAKTRISVLHIAGLWCTVKTPIKRPLYFHFFDKMSLN